MAAPKNTPKSLSVFLGRRWAMGLPIKVAEIHVAVCNAILGGQYLANK